MARVGLLLLLVVMVIGGLEAWFAWWLAKKLDGEFFGVLLAGAALSWIGWTLLRRRLAQIPQALMGGGDLGRIAVGLGGCVLLLFPGFITGALGALVQIPLLQGLGRKTAGAALGALMRQAAAKMGGQFPGGANPFAGGKNPFPGGIPPQFRPGSLKPDAKTKGGRVIDVEAKR